MRTAHVVSILRVVLLTALSLGSLGCQPATPEPVISGLTGEPHHPSVYSVVPAPRSLTPGVGWFGVPAALTVATSGPEDARLRELAELAGSIFRERAGAEVVVDAAPARGPLPGAVTLALEQADAEAGAEAYLLEVTPAAVALRAASHAGLFYAVQTLRQLIATDEDGALMLPAVVIRDAPRFPYRGMHLDVGRHFFPVEFVKRYIDLLSRHKMNTFHWHLTEDQGWRLEIEGYPRLTEVGSCRSETQVAKNYIPFVGDGTRYCGFYTQAEAREVVEYAAARYVTVIPEIELPGHSLAALSAYPEYACTEGPFAAATGWGIFSDIYCPTEETFTFLEDVLGEVLEIFPSRYIHIGGDEAPKARWRESPQAQEVIRREGLADEDELQSYFIRRIERFLTDRGRRLIGWDEILEGGLAPEATVMSWRGTEGGIEAARQGHDVIMTPTSHAYFDYYQGEAEHEPLAIGGFLPLERVYGFEPVPAELSPEQAAHVLGAQGNVWTEFMKTPERVEYMAYPRALAMAEVAWSPAEARDLGDFERRLAARLERLEAIGVNFRIPEVRGLEHDRVSLDGRFVVALSSLFGDRQIRYTLDGSEPTVGSPSYSEPIEIETDEAGTFVTARVVLDSGRLGTLRRAHFRQTDLRPAEEIDRGGLSAGLRYAYTEYDRRVLSVDQLAELTPVTTGISRSVSLEVAEREELFGLSFTGFLSVPSDGIYTFSLTSDDGARLLVGGQLVADNDGIHGVSEQSGIIGLAAGLHPLTIRYFQRHRESELRLEVTLEGSGERLDVEDRLFHRGRLASR
jgi:hexosaminidase